MSERTHMKRRENGKDSERPPPPRRDSVHKCSKYNSGPDPTVWEAKYDSVKNRMLLYVMYEEYLLYISSRHIARAVLASSRYYLYNKPTRNKIYKYTNTFFRFALAANKRHLIELPFVPFVGSYFIREIKLDVLIMFCDRFVGWPEKKGRPIMVLTQSAMKCVSAFYTWMACEQLPILAI